MGRHHPCRFSTECRVLIGFSGAARTGPFVIVLLALLAFVYLWWTAQENKDSQAQTIAKQEQSITDLRKVANSFGEKLAEQSRVLGWAEPLPSGVAGVEPTVVSDLSELLEHLKADGRIAGEGGETLGAMAQIVQDARVHDGAVQSLERRHCRGAAPEAAEPLGRTQGADREDPGHGRTRGSAEAFRSG